MKSYLLSSFMFLMVTGCCVYNPQTTDIPLINGKNDLRIDAGISLIPSVNATISYGLTNKMAIQAFGSIGSEDRSYFQVAPGIYKDFTNNNVMELYGGFGTGHGDVFNDANPGHLVGNYQIYFVQYNFGKHNSNNTNTDYGFGIKTGYFHSNLTDKNYYDIYPENVPYTTDKENSILIEPTIFARFGGEKFKFSIKAGACWVIKITNPDKYIPTQVINIGLGINYSFMDLTHKR